MFHPRQIFCAYKNYEMLKARYPKRIVNADRFCPNDEFYYFTRTKHVRRVKLEDWSIWGQIWEDGWPTMYQKRIR